MRASSFASSTATRMLRATDELLERRDPAVEHGRGAGRERVVLVPLEIGGEDRRQQEQPEHDARVPCGDRPAAVHRLRGAAGQRALGQRREREPETGPDRELRRDRPGGSCVGEPAERREAARDEDRAGGRTRPRAG